MRTPSQTVGPFLHIALLDSYGPELASPGSPGALRVWGCVLDGAGEAVTDALVEVWHAGRRLRPERHARRWPLRAL